MTDRQTRLLSPPCADIGTPVPRLLTDEERAERLEALNALADAYDTAIGLIGYSDRDPAEFL